MDARKPAKPVGGIAAAAVVPAGAAALGSAAEVAAAAVAVPLVEGRSSYDETTDSRDGTVRVEHLLTLAVPADFARRHLGEELCRRWATEGTAAVVVTEAGERLVAGWSERFGGEQPLRLATLELSTDKSPRAVPVALLTLRSVDTSPATRIQDSEFKIQNFRS